MDEMIEFSLFEGDETFRCMVKKSEVRALLELEDGSACLVLYFRKGRLGLRKKFYLYPVETYETLRRQFFGNEKNLPL